MLSNRSHKRTSRQSSLIVTTIFPTFARAIYTHRHRDLLAFPAVYSRHFLLPNTRDVPPRIYPLNKILRVAHATFYRNMNNSPLTVREIPPWFIISSLRCSAVLCVCVRERESALSGLRDCAQFLRAALEVTITYSDWFAPRRVNCAARSASWLLMLIGGVMSVFWGCT